MALPLARKRHVKIKIKKLKGHSWSCVMLYLLFPPIRNGLAFRTPVTIQLAVPPPWSRRRDSRKALSEACIWIPLLSHIMSPKPIISGTVWLTPRGYKQPRWNWLKPLCHHLLAKRESVIDEIVVISPHALFLCPKNIRLPKAFLGSHTWKAWSSDLWCFDRPCEELFQIQRGGRDFWWRRCPGEQENHCRSLQTQLQGFHYQ